MRKLDRNQYSAACSNNGHLFAVLNKKGDGKSSSHFSVQSVSSSHTPLDDPKLLLQLMQIQASRLSASACIDDEYDYSHKNGTK